jgi:hypothetical protein
MESRLLEIDQALRSENIERIVNSSNRAKTTIVETLKILKQESKDFATAIEILEHSDFSFEEPNILILRWNKCSNLLTFSLKG